MARDAHRLELAADLDLDLIALARTGPGPYSVVAELPGPWIAGILAHTDAEVAQPGKVRLEVTSIGNGTSVLVRGDLNARFVVPCARCLEPAEVLAGGELCVHFVRGAASDALRDEEDSDLAAEDVERPDERAFLGTRLDLRPMIEEQIRSVPSAPAGRPAAACACTAGPTSTSSRRPRAARCVASSTPACRWSPLREKRIRTRRSRPPAASSSSRPGRPRSAASTCRSPASRGTSFPPEPRKFAGDHPAQIRP